MRLQKLLEQKVSSYIILSPDHFSKGWYQKQKLQNMYLTSGPF